MPHILHTWLRINNKQCCGFFLLLWLTVSVVYCVSFKALGNPKLWLLIFLWYLGKQPVYVAEGYVSWHQCIPVWSYALYCIYPNASSCLENKSVEKRPFWILVFSGSISLFKSLLEFWVISLQEEVKLLSNALFCLILGFKPQGGHSKGAVGSVCESAVKASDVLLYSGVLGYFSPWTKTVHSILCIAVLCMVNYCNTLHPIL